MKKQLLAGTLAFGLVGGSLVGAPLQEGNTVEAASVDCQITIDANKHDITNLAKGKGSKKACGELEGYYTPDKTFTILYPEPYFNLSNGQILKDVWFNSGDSLDVKVNTIGEKTEKPKPEKPQEPKPEQPKDPKPEKPSEPKPDKPKDPKPEKPSEPKPEQPKDPKPEKPSEQKPEQPSKPTPEKPEQEKPSTGDNGKGTNGKGGNTNVIKKGNNNDGANNGNTQTTENDDVNTDKKVDKDEKVTADNDEDDVVAGNDNNNNNNNGTNNGNTQTTEKGEVVGEKLPDTATNTYNLGLLGGMLALLGSAVGFVFNRKAKMD